MKKVFVLFIITTTLLITASCGNKQNNSNVVKTNENTKEALESKSMQDNKKEIVYYKDTNIPIEVYDYCNKQLNGDDESIQDSADCMINNLQIEINSKYLTIPFIGKQLEETGYEFNSMNTTLAKWMEVYDVDLKRQTNEIGYTMYAGYINNSNEDTDYRDCYVTNIKSIDNDSYIIFNNDCTNKIGMKNSLDDVLNKLSNIGIPVRYHAESHKIEGYDDIILSSDEDASARLLYDKYNNIWSINIDIKETAKNQAIYKDAKDYSSELRKLIPTEKREYTITFTSNSNDELEKIEVDFMYENTDTYTKRYYDMNE